ncbi:helix-turn-helix domain-containing protein [Nocardia gipuzkoensis]|uniref:helix-turn-helix domain-containing protein n=1 Tax=Nocardia gipuzkoensis TaxID=2749991 RepID=UPI001E2FEFA8|nr:helix-turn-helix transcriptional regulator [Nocardia gipuzkoensis]UGT66895.1 helix-turn-helix domain-containing protein [Nocardia gipuzkoensis]
MGEREAGGEDRQVEAGIRGTGGVPHRSLGRCLRGMRQEAGLSIEVASRAIGRGAGTLHRLETGAPNVIVRDEDLRRLCRLYQRVDMLPVLKSLAAQGRTPSWLDEFPDQVNPTFNAYIQMEAAASHLTFYRPDMVPGLFQIPDYARALDRAYFPMDTAEEIERRVRVRRNRQALITRDFAPLAAMLILDEAAIRRVVGSPRIMSTQLRHLADLPPNVRVYVMPFGAGFPLGTSTGPFTVLDFAADGDGRPLEPPVVHVQSYTGDIYLERANTVRRYKAGVEVMRRVALDTPNSKRLLRQVAKEFDCVR